MAESNADQQETQVEPQSAKTFKCANCAAKMEFKPGAQAQECPYCGHSNPIPQSEEDIQFAYRLAESTTGRVFFTAGNDLDR